MKDSRKLLNGIKRKDTSKPDTVIIMNDSHEQHRSLILRILLIPSGIIVITGAIIRIIKFVNDIPKHETMTSSQFAHGVIIPHMMLLLGLVLTAWGIILMIRHSIIKSRMSGAATAKNDKQN